MTSSSTTAELVGVDDLLPKVLWVPLFLKEQRYEVENNVIFQDNTSAILLEKNGKRSSGERTRALNIRFFLITDHIEKGEVSVEHCPMDRMIGDFYMNPLQGQKFQEFRNLIMRITKEQREGSVLISISELQECIGLSARISATSGTINKESRVVNC